MMHVNFYSLILQCKKSKEIIDLAHQVLFFHGKVSSGKSSIARLISFCLGGNIERTIAIQKEVVNVSLELAIGKYKVLLERNTEMSSFVIATCVDENNNSFIVNAPVNAGLNPVYAEKVYSLSDLVFYLLDLNVLRIPSNKVKEDANLVRLSIKNFMWYCYLDQSKMDSSFFRHEDATKTRNSKEVLKYILQYSTQKLVELQEELLKIRKIRFQKIATAEGLREFLKKFNFSSEDEIEKLVLLTKNKLEKAKEERNKLESGYSANTHFVDKTRDRIRTLIEELETKVHGINDLQNRIGQQESLRAELIASKFKIARSHAVANIFQGIQFKNCPCCGTSVVERSKKDDVCELCLSPIGIDTPGKQEQAEVIQIDLNERVKELDTSIDLHKKALSKTRKEYEAKEKIRHELDEQLQHDLRQYESIFLSNIRGFDNEIAKFKERLKSLNRLKQMPREINKLEEESGEIVKRERKIKQQIDEEQANFVKGESLIQDLEDTFLEVMKAVGMPGISKNDKVHINRKTWDVTILPAGEDYLRWNFYNAGSGGKKTLFNSCFLLAIHIVASKNGLPLPSFIIIDTPMKNIDKEVNQDIFKSFYDYLYQLAATVLDNTQFIIVDNNYIPPGPDLKLSFKDRYMEAGNTDYPPLIPYYEGP